MMTFIGIFKVSGGFSARYCAEYSIRIHGSADCSLGWPSGFAL